MKRSDFIKTIGQGLMLSSIAPISHVCLRNGYKGFKYYDVIVYGGSPAGVTAAIQVARMGKTVRLIVPYAHIGGILVNGMGSTDIDSQNSFQNSIAVGGLALEFYERIAKVYGREKQFKAAVKNKIKDHSLWIHEPHIAKKCIIDWLSEYSDKIDILFNCRLKEDDHSVRKVNRKITQIMLDNGEVIQGRIFIDATITGDLLKGAGISYFVGREANSQYNEKFNGVIANTTHAQFKVKVNPYNTPGNPESGLIPTIQEGSVGVSGAEDITHLQAYCYRPCLTEIDSNKITFRKPLGYDRNQYEIYVRYLNAGGKLYIPKVNIPNEKCDFSSWDDLGHNLYGMNVGYVDGDYSKRKQIEDEHRYFTEGLFYFLANDSVVGMIAPELQKKWHEWGLAKDEFVDNRNWPRQLYVRDGRRMISDYVITEHQILDPDAYPVKDPVALAYWPMDVHSVRRIVLNQSAYNEGAFFRADGPWKPLQISFRALIPKENECINFLTPTCLSTSHIAYGSIRIEWTYMALGQAVGTAAVLAIESNTSVQAVKYEDLKKRLTSDNQIISVQKKN